MGEKTVPDTETLMGWCIEGRHTHCHKRVERFYINPTPKKGNSPVVYLGEYIKCKCQCHKDANDTKKTKITNKRSN